MRKALHNSDPLPDSRVIIAALPGMKPLGSSDVEYLAFLIFGTKSSPVPVEPSPETKTSVVGDGETEGRDGV
jgi:hypothetical protein